MHMPQHSHILLFRHIVIEFRLSQPYYHHNKFWMPVLVQEDVKLVWRWVLSLGSQTRLFPFGSKSAYQACSVVTYLLMELPDLLNSEWSDWKKLVKPKHDFSCVLFLVASSFSLLPPFVRQRQPSLDQHKIQEFLSCPMWIHTFWRLLSVQHHAIFEGRFLSGLSDIPGRAVNHYIVL